jgi:signal peptidase I
MKRRNFITALLGVSTVVAPQTRAALSVQLKKVTVKTGSMLPSLPIESVLTLDTAYYQTKPVERFDIVGLIRRDPHYPGGPPITAQYVARVIGLPGEAVSLRANTVYIDERPLKEPMRTLPCEGEEDESEWMPCATVKATQVPAEQYYLLADNRAESMDSRLWHPSTIPAMDIVGKVVGITLPTAAQLSYAAEPAQRSLVDPGKAVAPAR